jgi:hypothetical protein
MKPTSIHGSLKDKYTQILLDLYDTLPRNERGNVSSENFVHEIAADPQVRFLIECRKEEQGLIIIKFIETLQDSFPYDISETDLKRALSLYSLKNLIITKSRQPEVSNIEFDSSSWKKQKSQKPLITVPKPFSFLYREDTKPKSIRQQKLEEMVEDKRKEEEFHLNYRPPVKEVPTEVLVPKLQTVINSREGSVRQITVPEPFSFLSKEYRKPRSVSSESEFRFKAKEVPGFVKELRFERMVQEEVKKKKQLREKLTNQLNKSAPDLMKAFMKPLKEKIKEDKTEFKFKAKDVPYFVKEARYEKMISEETKDRNDRIKQSAMQSLNKSKMPPRMERHQNERKSTEEYVDPNLMVKFKAKPVPKSVKRKENVAATEKEVTEVGGLFQVEETVKGDFSAPGMKSPIQSLVTDFGLQKKIIEVVKTYNTTKKFESMKQLKQKKDQEAEEARQKLEAEERERKEKHEKAVQRVKEKGLIPKLIQSLKPPSDTSGQAFFATVMQNIQERVSSRPLLTEQVTSSYSKANSRISTAEKLRKLAQAKGINLPEFKTWD